MSQVRAVKTPQLGLVFMTASDATTKIKTTHNSIQLTSMTILKQKETTHNL